MKKNSVAIIGAGVTGIGIAKEFLDKGWLVTIFDREDEPGGTWCKKYIYADLKLHSKTGTYLFPGFPFHDKSHDIKNEKASGEQVNEYIKQFMRKCKLDEHVIYNAKVDKLIYNHKKKNIQVITSVTPDKDMIFDFAIVTGHTTNLKTPDFAGADTFKGKVIHSSLAKQSLLQEAITNNKKIIVLGGNKSATDMVSYFTSRNYKNITWVHRKTHWFLKEEKMKLSLDAILFLLVVYSLFTFNHIISEKWKLKLCRILASRQIIINPRSEDCSMFLNKFNSGIMDESLYNTLLEVQDFESSVRELKGDKVILENSEEIPCDYLICATGYDTKLGFPNIEQIDKQGRLQDSHIYDIEQLYRGQVHPNFPRLGFAHKRPVFFGAPSVANVTGAWFFKHFQRVNDISPEHLYQEIINELALEKPQYKKYSLSYGDPFSGSYVHENMWFWFLFMQRLYKKDLNLPPFFFLRFVFRFLAKKTHHTIAVNAVGTNFKKYLGIGPKKK